MKVTEQGLPISGHAGTIGGSSLLVLLLFAVALGCHQREAMEILAPMIREELRLNFPDLGNVLASFALASAPGFLLMAVFIWREKSWVGYAVLGILGGLGALLTGASSGVGGLIVARGIAGLAYGGLLLGAYQIVGEWLSRESHGLAIGLIRATTLSMAPLTPIMIAAGATPVGWRWSSRVVAALWFVWLLIWIWLFRRSGDTLRHESHHCPVTLAQMFKDPVTWAVVVGVSLSAPLLSFRSGQLLGQAIDLVKSNRPHARWFFALILLPAVGAVAAGLISDVLIRKGWSAGKSRTALVTICGLMMSFPALFAFSRNPVIYLLCAMLSVTAGQGLVAILYTVLVDAIPGRGIILGVALAGWLSGLMSNVANMMTEPISGPPGSGPLLIGLSILTLIAVVCVRALIRKVPAGLVPA